VAVGDRPPSRRDGLLGPGAALTTPTDMAQWLPVAHAHGRVDLDATTLMDRRDAFLRAALEQLDRL
jgi:hypothetical protein